MSQSAPVAANTSSNKARYGSFDAIRALGAFGVIFIHIGLICDNRLTLAVSQLQDLFSGVVPFFLTTAFYFAARREKRGELTPWKSFLGARTSRLLLPFLLWNIIYIALRAAVAVVGHQPDKLANLFSDPVALFLFGGAGVMLYFLPLLFIGLVELRFSSRWLRVMTANGLAVSFFLSLLLSGLMVTSGNAFSLGINRAFIPLTAQLALRSGGTDINNWLLVRTFLIILSHLVISAPLVVFAFAALHFTWQEKKVEAAGAKSRFNWPLSLATLAIFALFVRFYVFGGAERLGFWGTIAGMMVFLFALVSVEAFPSTAFLSRLGSYTFGIYLVHQVILTGLRLALGRHLPSVVNLPLAVALALTAFVISYFITALAARGGAFSRRLFAIEG